MLGELPTEPFEPVPPLDPDPLPPPEPPVAVDPAVAPGLTVAAEEPALGAVEEGAADPAAGADWASAAVLVVVESPVTLPGDFTAAFLPPPHAANAAMTAMHNRIRRTQLPPHRRTGARLLGGRPRPPTDSRQNEPVDGEALRRRWHHLFDPFGAPRASVAEAFDDVVRHYAEARRHYHTLEHIDRVLASVDLLGEVTEDPTAVELAAWLHDVIYDPRARDNEARSAELARELLARLQVPSVINERVAELILTTIDHQTGGDTDAEVLLDADLSVLGAESAAYDDYRAAIREEFAWLPEPAYRAGRATLLRRFLERRDIFHTTLMKEALEEQARRNIQRELGELEPAIGG
jgi:predicted metal-dependent HD superfamily phosphohydrolase